MFYKGVASLELLGILALGNFQILEFCWYYSVTQTDGKVRGICYETIYYKGVAPLELVGFLGIVLGVSVCEDTDRGVGLLGFRSVRICLT
jgi:hypothetical protein